MKNVKAGKTFFVLLIVTLMVSGILLWFDMSRTYYCFSGNICITVWKRIGGTCYIISNKYSDWKDPKESYIKTSNTQYLTLYYSKKLPDKIIVRNQGTAEGLNGTYFIHGNIFVEYGEKFEKMIYGNNVKYENDVQADVYFINVDIKENYAVDNLGNKP